MVALRGGYRGTPFAPYGLAALFFALASTQVARQDLAALMAQQPAVFAHAREHLIASPFGTIHAALFSLPQPVGTVVPASDHILLAKFDPTQPGAAEVLAPSPAGRADDAGATPPPEVNRAAKGDLLVPPVQIEINREIIAALHGQPPVGAPPSGDEELEAAVRFTPFPEYDISLSLELHPQVPTADAARGDEPDGGDGDALTDFGEIRLYFEGVPMTAVPQRIEAWAPGEAPILDLPMVADARDDKAPAAAGAKPEPRKEPVTVAAKGAAPETPTGFLTAAMRLKLSGKARAKAERCLANAVYFEARSESVRGQIAVAQVVLNRVFSGYYPEDVCGVVYQGARRHLSCQFTFACDGIPDVVTEPDAWERAKRIANAALDGKVWLKDVGKATHYHAYWVNPYWVRSMRRLQRIGVHSFYRPRRWGDGSDAPVWGHAANPALAAKF
jgi:spore germination cell wall hydrolase CwlJ-like protein